MVLATGPFLEHNYFGLTEIYCQGPGLSGPRSGRICAEDLGAAVDPPWLVTEASDHQQRLFLCPCQFVDVYVEEGGVYAASLSHPTALWK